jgi:ribosome-associated protein
VASPPFLRDDGALVISRSCVIAAEDVVFTYSTAGGPGGQHANRSLTAVTATLDIAASPSLRERERALLMETLGRVARSTASRHRSRGQNQTAALEQLAAKLARGLHRDPVRRPTTPSKAAKSRRVDQKKARGRTKALRRTTED